jgi:hypothetical protein
MDGERGYTIAIQPTDASAPRKITKILSLNGQGFSVLAPYHKAKSGFVWKVPVPANIGHARKLAKGRVSIYGRRSGSNLAITQTGLRNSLVKRPGVLHQALMATQESRKALVYLRTPWHLRLLPDQALVSPFWGIEDFEEAEADDQVIRPRRFLLSRLHTRRSKHLDTFTVRNSN